MAAERQRGLGRGLAALLGESEASATGAPASGVGIDGPPRELPIEMLERNEAQPRQTFDEAQLEELSASIRERGVLQPILVRPLAEGRYQIVAGERRWRAAQRAGLHAIPAIVRELTDGEVLEVAIVENVQRADLDAVEEALAYRALMERFGHKQDDVARLVGKSRSHVANTLRLTQLPPAVTAMVQAGQLTAGHARALINAPDPETLAGRVVALDLTVRETENLAREAGGNRPAPKRARESAPPPARSTGGGADTRALEADLAEILGLPAVEIIERGGRGELRLSYSSIEQLDHLCDRLTRPVFGRV